MKRHFKRVFHILALLSLVAVSLITNYEPAHAAVIRVNTPTDEDGGPSSTSKCSLREAIISANEGIAFGGCAKGTRGAVDTIIIPAANRSYALSRPGAEDAARRGDLDILEPVEIYGDANNPPVINSSSALDRVFHIIANGEITLQNLIITGGDYVDKGGGIYIETKLDSKGNPVYRSRVTLNYVSVMDNHASYAGGGIWVDKGAVAMVYFSNIMKNTSDSAGGIQNEGFLHLDSSLVTDNSNTGVVANSLTTEQRTRIYNSTISQNDAQPGSGAGIAVASYSILELNNVTIVDNRGIGLELKDYSNGTIMNTIIARQKKAEDIMPNCVRSRSSSFQSQGYNLTSDSSCELGEPGDQTVLVEQLGMAGSYGHNGGPTQTYALEDVSPAVDAGNNGTCRTTDQRMRGRPAIGKPHGSAVCDIGAFELNGKLFKTFLPINLR